MYNNSCPDCNQPNTSLYWCQNCNSKRFQQDFNKWTSGNELIDNFIQDTQLKARHCREVIEWILYNRFRNIQHLAQGGFSTIYKAVWLDGCILGWDKEKQQWVRNCPYFDKDYKIAKQGNVKSPLNEYEEKGLHVVLKSLNNSSNIHGEFLNEWKSYLKIVHNYEGMIGLFGITQDPETSNYMAVMFYMELGSLRSNLMIKKYNPNDKYTNLRYISDSLSALHNCNLVHGDFHSGNLLSSNYLDCHISDFGLSKPADQPIKSKEIYGVIPYIAPEVLRGRPYTKAADIYSFGIIMWEMTSGIPAFNNVTHDFNLALRICEGLRPKIIDGTEIEYVELMKRCWDTDPGKRPTAEKLFEHFYICNDKFPYNDERTPVPENEPVVKNHPLSCYTSRKIDYAAKLNEILSQRELSSKIIVDDEEYNYEETILSESLDDCRISE